MVTLIRSQVLHHNSASLWDNFTIPTLGTDEEQIHFMNLEENQIEKFPKTKQKSKLFSEPLYDLLMHVIVSKVTWPRLEVCN